MELYERVRHLRKDILKVSQEDFSRKIGVSRSNIGNIEIGRIKLTDRNIEAICSAYNVSEAWLRTGEGDPYLPEPSFAVALERLCDQYNLPAAHRALLRAFLDLPDHARDVFSDYVKSEVKRAANAEAPPSPAPDVDGVIPDGIIPIDDREGIRNLVYPLIDAAEAGLRDDGAGKSSS